MATVLSFTSAKSMVISWLQASRTAWATTVDGSNAQYSSDTEIANAILSADGILATVIANTLQHPFQSTFVQTSSALASGSALPARNGMILKVLCLDSPVDLTFTSGDVTIADNSINMGGNGAFVVYNLSTGLRVQFTTAGTLPTGLAISTDYWIRVDEVTKSLVYICRSPLMATTGIDIDLTGTGSGTSTMVMQYEEGTEALSKDEVIAASNFPELYATTYPNSAKFWFIEGDYIYTTSAYAKVVYTDYTLTASPQCPEPYLEAVAAGAVAYLAKDGSDDGLALYYQKIFDQYVQMTSQGATALPAISGYKMAA